MQKIKFFLLLCFIGASLCFTSCKKEDAIPSCYGAEVLELVCTENYYAIRILNADLGVDNWKGVSPVKNYDNVITIHRDLLPKDYQKIGQKFYFSSPVIENPSDILCQDLYAGSPGKFITSFTFSSTECNKAE